MLVAALEQAKPGDGILLAGFEVDHLAFVGGGPNALRELIDRGEVAADIPLAGSPTVLDVEEEQGHPFVPIDTRLPLAAEVPMIGRVDLLVKVLAQAFDGLIAEVASFLDIEVAMVADGAKDCRGRLDRALGHVHGVELFDLADSGFLRGPLLEGLQSVCVEEFRSLVPEHRRGAVPGSLVRGPGGLRLEPHDHAGQDHDCERLEHVFPPSVRVANRSYGFSDHSSLACLTSPVKQPLL